MYYLDKFPIDFNWKQPILYMRRKFMLENKKDFLDTQDFKKETLEDLIRLAVKMKKDKKKYQDSLKGKKLGMIFEKSSTRTRVSFEAGIYELGGMGIFLSQRDMQLGRGEPLKDTAKVLSRYLDGLMVRTFKQSNVEELAREGTIPVINGLTDLLHPCQAIADFQAIHELKGKLAGLKLCFIGDGNNVAHSLGLLASKVGMHYYIATPKGYEMKEEIVKQIESNSRTTGSRVDISNDPVRAVDKADVIYTDVWTSMGQEEETKKRLQDFQGFEINSKLVGSAAKDFIFLHCLPAHRGEEVSAEVIDGPHSFVIDQAENRLHAQKAVMYSLMR
jgi:ornithine carbamoyltransferase